MTIKRRRRLTKVINRNAFIRKFLSTNNDKPSSAPKIVHAHADKDSVSSGTPLTDCKWPYTFPCVEKQQEVDIFAFHPLKTSSEVFNSLLTYKDRYPHQYSGKMENLILDDPLPFSYVVCQQLVDPTTRLVYYIDAETQELSWKRHPSADDYMLLYTDEPIHHDRHISDLVLHVPTLPRMKKAEGHPK